MVYLMALLIFFIPQLVEADLFTGLDEGNYYATAVAENKSKAISQQEACALAKRELIGSVFGLNTQVVSSMVQTLNEYQLTNQITLDSDKVQLKGLQSHVQTRYENARYVSVCRITYPEAEAKKEKLRLTKMQEVLERDKLNKASFEGADPIRFGRILVRSNVRSKVYIDSILFGLTPLEVDRVTLGHHQITVEAQDYIPESRTVDVTLGQVLEVHFNLKKNRVALILDIEPSSAHFTVFINGVPQPKSDLIYVDPEPFILRIEAPHYYPYQDRFHFKAGAEIRHKISLVAKPVPVSFLSETADTTVYLNDEQIGKTPLTVELKVGQYKVGFLSSSQGIIDSRDFFVSAGQPLTIKAVKKVTNSVAPSFYNVMVYKDPSLTIGKGYQSREAAPSVPINNSQMVDVELSNPKRGYIFVDGKLAGKKIVQIDELDNQFTVKFEAPGYYDDQFSIRPISVKNSAEYRKINCGKDNLKIQWSADQPPYTYCEYKEELDIWKYFVFPLGLDENAIKNRVYLKVHLFKKLQLNLSPKSIPSEAAPCCHEVLATLIFQESDRYYLNEDIISYWLKNRYPGLNFHKYDMGFFAQPIYVAYVPASYNRIPAIVGYEGIEGYDLVLPENENGYPSSLLFSDTPDFIISDRVIVVYDKKQDTDFLQKISKLNIRADFSLAKIQLESKQAQQLAALRERATQAAQRYGIHDSGIRVQTRPVQSPPPKAAH